MVLPGLIDLLDVAIVAAFVWLAIGAFRRTRARSALIGLATLAFVYLIASNVGLRLTTTLLQAFFAAVVLLSVVVFQDDIRRFFDGLGAWRGSIEPRVADSDAIDALARVVARLAAGRTGALIVLPGAEPLDRHMQGGVALGGDVSEPLLLSLFDASSPGHDGAVLIRDGRVERFAIHLPLSTDHDALHAAGTRHAAALGLAERSDALVIVVSEERGTVSIAEGGEIRVLSRPEDVAGVLARRLAPPVVDPASRRQRLREAGLSVAGAVALWALLVPGSDLREITIDVPVAITNLPPGKRLDATQPGSVEVTLRGTRRDLFWVDESDVSVEIDAYLVRLGRRTFTVAPANVRKPRTLEILSIVPDSVLLSIEPNGGDEAEGPSGESGESGD